MGKVRTKKEVRKKSTKIITAPNDTQLKNTVVKLESDIGAISLGPPRSKILKKSAPSSASSSQLSSNFASRINVHSKEKKKVRFCQNIIAEELKEQQKGSSSEDAKHYFKVIHPSAIEKRKVKLAGAKANGGPTKILESIIPDPEVLMATSSRALRKIIKNSTKNKKTILKAKKASFKKKLELIKSKKDELLKAKQRQQTVIVGDIHPLLQALPDVTSNTDDGAETELLAKKASDEKPKFAPNKTKFSVKKTQQAILDSLKFFEASGVSAGIGVTKT